MVETTRYFYTPDNMLEYVDLPGDDNDRHFVYDGLGRRIIVETGEVDVVGDDFDDFTPTPSLTKKFVYLGGSVIRELDNSNNVVKEYVRGPDLGGGIGGIIYQRIPQEPPEDDRYSYYHYNHKGDVVALTDGSENLAAYYEYDAWGNVMTEAETSGVDNPYRYSTKEWDEKSGLYYFGARYYSPEIGRWTQRDPLGTVDGLNLYLYVGNGPISQSDAWGFTNGGYGPYIPRDYGKKEKETCLKAIKLAELALVWCEAELRAFFEKEKCLCKGEKLPPMKAYCSGLPTGHRTVPGPRGIRVSFIDMWMAYDSGVEVTAILVGHEYTHQVCGGFMLSLAGKPIIGKKREEQAERGHNVFAVCFQKMQSKLPKSVWKQLTSRP